jgi:hypothetical protein
MSDDEYEEILNELYGEVDICGELYNHGTVLRTFNPMRFNSYKADYESMYYMCGECSSRHEEEDMARECCSELHEED